jgi:hypothetical protein
MSALTVYKGDAFQINGVVTDSGSSPIDCTGWSIRCEIYDETTSLKKGDATVTGGASTQAEWTDASSGEFSVYVSSGDTTSFSTSANIEIEVETDSGNKYTIYQNTINFTSTRINWTSIT